VVVVAAPASLKGVLSAVDAASALAAGLHQAGLTPLELPVADGGEGTAEIFARALGGSWRLTRVSDPLGRIIRARYLLLSDGTAVVESAEALGLDRVRVEDRDPLSASSRGLGELIRAALHEAPAQLMVCLGGTGTVDGGAGLLEVLEELPKRTQVLCDVANPLIGDRGAARVFGPQKGASETAVEILEERLSSMRLITPFATTPGAGAGGGLGAALAALGAELRPGAEVVLDVLGFREAIRDVALVITGEGTVDQTTFEGKAPGAVIQACTDLGVDWALFGGRLKAKISEAPIYSLSGDPKRAVPDLVALGERIGQGLTRR
jgi:glycerate kinase